MSRRITEDYIKRIYPLQRRGKQVMISTLAARLDLADASIRDTVKNLFERGHVRYEP